MLVIYLGVWTALLSIRWSENQQKKFRVNSQCNPLHPHQGVGEGMQGQIQAWPKMGLGISTTYKACTQKRQSLNHANRCLRTVMTPNKAWELNILAFVNRFVSVSNVCELVYSYLDLNLAKGVLLVYSVSAKGGGGLLIVAYDVSVLLLAGVCDRCMCL